MADTAFDRLQVSGDEAGTPPEDRRFRPDVEGLRAVAIALVVLYHSNVPGVTGGYVGVDVFFVISGFVITGLLLRERSGTGGTSLVGFYARRCRRILPAATLVILIAVLFSYVFLGVVTGNNTADDGRWAAVFLSNFHFESIGTSYFGTLRAPSPLQNYWSLSVEEQFYIVYPTLFLLVARAKARTALRARLTVVLGVIIFASYSLSIVQTSSQPAAAYFSPFARAWELALGALIAVTSSQLKRLPTNLAAALTWVGTGAILLAAFGFTAHTAYPGSLVALPVVGAALVIAGGTAAPRLGVEFLLGLRPFGWLGKRSYSLYLWHWPILVIVAEEAGKTTLPAGESLFLIVFLAVPLSMLSYRLVENPIRHWHLPSKTSVVAGMSLVVVTVAVLTIVINEESISPVVYRVTPAENTKAVLSAVNEAPAIERVPKSMEPPISNAASDFIGFGGSLDYGCGDTMNIEPLRQPLCTIGDTSGRRLMIVYGDSHAIMWLPAFDAIARAAHWRLVVIGAYFCPAELVTVANPPQSGRQGSPYLECNRWHSWVVDEINRMDPSLVVISQESYYRPPTIDGKQALSFTPAQWQAGLKGLLEAIKIPNNDKVVIGNIPVLAESAPACLARKSPIACSTPAEDAHPPLAEAEHAAALAIGSRYVDPRPWLCSKMCTPIIGRYLVYTDKYHITSTYAQFLENVLARAVGFPLTLKGSSAQQTYSFQGSSS